MKKLKILLIMATALLSSLSSFSQVNQVDFIDHQLGDYIYLIERKNSIATILNRTEHEIEVLSVNNSTMSAQLKSEALYNGMYFATVSGNYTFKGKIYSRNFPIDIAKYRESTLDELDDPFTTAAGDTIDYFPGYIAKYLVFGVKFKVDGETIETVLIKEMPAALAIGEENHFQRIVIEITEADLGISKKISFKNEGNFSIQLKSDRFLVVLENRGGVYERPVFDGALPPDGVYEFEALIKLPELGWRKIKNRESIKLSMVNGTLLVKPEDILGGIVKTPATTPAAGSSQATSSRRKTDLVLSVGSKRHKDVWFYNAFNKDIIFYIPTGGEEGNQAMLSDRVAPNHLDNTGVPVKMKIYPGVYPVFYVDKDFNSEFVVLSNLTVGNQPRQKASFTKSGIRKF